MKAKDLRKLSPEELVKKEEDTREELFRMRFKHNIRKVENTSQLNLLRKDIARIKTLLNQTK